MGFRRVRRWSGSDNEATEETRAAGAGAARRRGSIPIQRSPDVLAVDVTATITGGGTLPRANRLSPNRYAAMGTGSPGRRMGKRKVRV